MKKAILMLVLAMSVPACDKSEDATEAAKAESAATEAAKAESAGSAGESDSNPDAKEGSITFAVDGEKKSFSHLPAKKNMAMSMSTMIVARPAAGATEEFSITAMNFNVKTADLPATLKLEMKKAMEEGDGMKFAKAPKPLVQYTSADGVQYRSYAEITFESFDDNVATGNVADIELSPVKPKNKNMSPIKISGLTFSVKL